MSSLASLATNSKTALVYGYIRKQCEQMNTAMIPADCINICYLYATKLIRIPLKIHSFRGSSKPRYRGLYHKATTEDTGPKWLINDDEKSAFTMIEAYYCSERMKQFEEDWIIFAIDESQNLNRQSFWLKQMRIRNIFNAFSQRELADNGVKTMKIEVGNMKDAKWRLCEMNPAVIEKGDRWQSVDLNIPFSIDDKYVKVSFIESHQKAVRSGKSPRKTKQFVVNRLRLYGVCFPVNIIKMFV